MMFSLLGWVSFSDETLHSGIATVYFPAARMQSQFRVTLSTLGSPHLWKLTHPLPKTPVNRHHKNYFCPLSAGNKESASDSVTNNLTEPTLALLAS